MKLFKMEIYGHITFEYDRFQKIKIIQEDGLKVDVINRFAEISESFIGKPIQVSYWVADKLSIRNELIESFLTQISGGIVAEYEASEYCYSSYIRGVDYDSTLKIGRHNMLNELSDKEGKFILLQIIVQL